MNIQQQAESIVMASDCTNNRYTLKDANSDRKAQEKIAYNEKVSKWLQDNPRIGSFNSGKFYYHDVNRHFQYIDVFGVVPDELPATHITNILKRVTLLEAQEYQLDSEKYLFCIDYLDMSANQPNADHLVEKLESHFEQLLKDES